MGAIFNNLASYGFCLIFGAPAQALPLVVSCPKRSFNERREVDGLAHSTISSWAI